MFSLLLAVIYLSFISLGLPDSLLGSAWPSMYGSFGVPVSHAGIVSMIIALGTIASSLQSDRLTRRFGTGRVTAFSVAMTAAALLGFSASGSFWQLCLWAVPYGLGAGSVDASLNNYVAVNYESRHMSWLHCMWGVGASVGPYIMGYTLSAGQGWPAGYRLVGLLQAVLAALLLLILPLWRRCGSAGTGGGTGNAAALTLPQVLGIPGAKPVMLMFFSYCALESTAGLWAASYLVLHRNFPAEEAARYASMFYTGMTLGRAASGLMTMRLSDARMIRLGQCIVAAGVAALLLPFGGWFSVAGLLLIGLGCAPIYPCIIHSTPEQFGADKSQALIGVQMASAYTGTCLMPPAFGLLAQNISVTLLPAFLLFFLVLMFATHRLTMRRTGHQ